MVDHAFKFSYVAHLHGGRTPTPSPYRDFAVDALRLPAMTPTREISLRHRAAFFVSGAHPGFRTTRLIMLTALLVVLGSFVPSAFASHHYTQKQLDALAQRVGKIFWLANSPGAQQPVFYEAPAAGAASFQPAGTDSFTITELSGQRDKNPYYAVRFESGKTGYIRPEAFHEALNVSILSADPRAGEKEKAEKTATEEKERLEWIDSQPWSAAVKEAAIKKQPPPGLKTSEINKVLGPPLRVTKLRGPSKAAEEHWFYPGGRVLIFHNGLLTRIDELGKKK